MSDHSTRPTRLLALGAAAVVSIYAAGFDRTRPAARRLAEEDAAHRRPPAEVRAVAQPPVTAAPAATDVVEVVEVAPAAAASVPKPAKPAKPLEAAIVAPTVERAPVVDSASPSAPATIPVPAPAAAPAADTATSAVAPPKWRDGTYSGWGNSRHGSIEATVTIRAGKITEAYISRCETRYSCSWIEHLQIQVVDRQGPEVDFVSGATQSVNAFYYAVVEALAKAK